MNDETSVSIIENEVSPIVATTQSIVIGSPEDMRNATEILSKLNVFNDRLIEDKERITKPLNAALKEIRAKYKPMEEKLGDAITVIRDKMETYQIAATRKLKEEQDKIAARIGEGKGKLKIETAVAKMDHLDVPEKNIEGDTGSVSFVTVKKFEVTDLSLVPIEYHLANEVAIRKAMKDGNELPGVRYFEEQSVRNSR